MATSRTAPVVRKRLSPVAVSNTPFGAAVLEQEPTVVVDAPGVSHGRQQEGDEQTAVDVPFIGIGAEDLDDERPLESPGPDDVRPVDGDPLVDDAVDASDDAGDGDTGSEDGVDAAAARAWLADQGVAVPQRGRLSRQHLAAYVARDTSIVSRRVASSTGSAVPTVAPGVPASGTGDPWAVGPPVAVTGVAARVRPPWYGTFEGVRERVDGAGLEGLGTVDKAWLDAQVVAMQAGRLSPPQVEALGELGVTSASAPLATPREVPEKRTFYFRPTVLSSVRRARKIWALENEEWVEANGDPTESGFMEMLIQVGLKSLASEENVTGLLPVDGRRTKAPRG